MKNNYPETIDLQRYNRDHAKLFLKHLGNGFYKIDCDDNSLYIDYMRIIFCEENNTKIFAIDPPAGPFISLESTIDNYKVKDITEDLTIKLEIINENI